MGEMKMTLGLCRNETSGVGAVLECGVWCGGSLLCPPRHAEWVPRQTLRYRERCLAWRYRGTHPLAPGAAMQDELWVSIRDIMSKGKKIEGKSRSWLVESDLELKTNSCFSFNFYFLVESGLFKDIFKDTFDALNFSPNRNNPEHFRFGKLLIITMSCSAFLISSQCYFRTVTILARLNHIFTIAKHVFSKWILNLYLRCLLCQNLYTSSFVIN